MRIFLWIAGAVAAVVAGIVAVFFLLDWNAYREDVAGLAGAAIGREVQIGELRVDPGWTTHIHIEDVTVANASWAKDRPFATVRDFRVAVRLWPLVSGRTDLPYMTVSGARLDLRKTAKGDVNWDFGAAGEAAARGVTPDDVSEFPVIGRFEIRESTFTYVDAEARVDAKGRLSVLEGEAAAKQGLTVELTGRLAGNPMRMSFAGGPVSLLRRGEAPYPLSFSISAGATAFSGEGHILTPFDSGKIDLQIKAKGPDLGRMLPSLKLPLPNTPPYDLAARVALDDHIWTVGGLRGTIGETDIRGSLAVDASGEKTEITGDLVSNRLFFDDLAPVFGLRAAGSEQSASAGKAEAPGKDVAAPAANSGGKKATGSSGRTGIFPDVPLDRERFETANADVRYRAKNIRSRILPFESLAGHIVLKDSKLTVTEIDARVADGRLTGEIVLDARATPPTTAASLSLRNLGLKPFFANSRFVEEMGGKFSGTISLRGKGDTLASVMAAADGAVRLGMAGGTISGLLVESAGLDLTEALGLLVEDARLPIRCGLIAVDIKNGAARIDRTVLDTADSTIFAGGVVRLDTETVELQVEARAKDFSLIDLDAPVSIKGPLAGPSVRIGGIDLLPFLEMGEQEDMDCSALIEEIAPEARDQ
mgnify:CR=1 FL=1